MANEDLTDRVISTLERTAKANTKLAGALSTLSSAVDDLTVEVRAGFALVVDTLRETRTEVKALKVAQAPDRWWHDHKKVLTITGPLAAALLTLAGVLSARGGESQGALIADEDGGALVDSDAWASDDIG